MLDIVGHIEWKPASSIDLILDVLDAANPNPSLFTSLALLNIQVNLLAIDLLLPLNHKR
jgi:hypothetical protein